jgi:hypothetical protein
MARSWWIDKCPDKRNLKGFIHACHNHLATWQCLQLIGIWIERLPSYPNNDFPMFIAALASEMSVYKPSWWRIPEPMFFSEIWICIHTSLSFYWAPSFRCQFCFERDRIASHSFHRHLLSSARYQHEIFCLVWASDDCVCNYHDVRASDDCVCNYHDIFLFLFED